MNIRLKGVGRKGAFAAKRWGGEFRVVFFSVIFLFSGKHTEREREREKEMDI